MSQRKRTYTSGGLFSTGIPQAYRHENPLRLPHVETSDEAPPPSPAPVEDKVLLARVREALANDTQLANADITVEVDAQVVRLSGNVHSHQDQRLAERIAESVAGVAAVTSDLMTETLTDGEHPWWTTGEAKSHWARVKAALARDWLQTKSDWRGETGEFLAQNIKDTLKQAAGTAPIPADAEPVEHTTELGADELHAIRIGFIARKELPHQEWTPELQEELRRAWARFRPGLRYERAMGAMEFGWRSGGTGL